MSRFYGSLCMYVFCYHISGEIKLCIRRSVRSSVYHTLVVAMLQLDYCNAAPAAVPVGLYLTVFSPFSTLQFSQSLVFTARLTSQTLLPVSIGYQDPSSESRLSRRSFTSSRTTHRYYFVPPTTISWSVNDTTGCCLLLQRSEHAFKG